MCTSPSIELKNFLFFFFSQKEPKAVGRFPAGATRADDSTATSRWAIYWARAVIPITPRAAAAALFARRGSERASGRADFWKIRVRVFIDRVRTLLCTLLYSRCALIVVSVDHSTQSEQR